MEKTPFPAKYHQINYGLGMSIFFGLWQRSAFAALFAFAFVWWVGMVVEYVKRERKL